MSEPKRKLAAIVFTDIVGFTKLSAENEPAALALLEKQRELLKSIVEKHGGSWLKEIGDGLLLSFNTSRDAVDCSIAIQKATKKVDDLNLRIAIHQGEVVFQGNDVVGDDVNIAARIEPFAAAGGIAISGRVNTSLERDPEFETMFIGTPALKGVSQKTEVYCITSHDLPKTDISKVSAKLEPAGFRWNVFSITGAVLTMIGILFWINISFLGIGFSQEEEIPSIAILYMKNLGSENDEAWAYGLTEDLIVEMSKKGLIRISTMNSVLKFKNSTISEREIASELDVKYVLTSSLHKTKDQFNLRCQLLNIRDGITLFGNKWTESIENSSLIVSNLADSVSSKINITSNRSKDQDRVKYRSDPIAYEYYLKGKYLWEKKQNAEDVEIAKDFLKKAIELDKNLVKAHHKLAVIHSAQGNLNKSFSMHKNCLKISRKLNDYEQIADSYLGIAGSHHALQNSDSAKYYFRKLLDISEEIDYRKGMKSAFNGLAIIAYFQEEDETTFEYMGRSLEIVRELEDRIELPNALIGLGQAYFIRGYFDKAYPLFQEAKEISIDTGNRSALAFSYALLGSYRSVFGDYMGANHYVKKTCTIYKELGLKDAYANYSVGLSYNYFYAGYLDSAFLVLDDLYDLAKESEYQSIYSLAANLAGYLHYRSENYEKALENFMDYNASLSDQTRGETRLNIYLFLALFNHNLGNIKEFDEWVNVSIDMIEDGKMEIKMPFNIVKIFELYTILGRDDKAKDILKKYFDYMNEIASRMKDPQKRNDYFYKNYYNRQIISELEKLGIS